LLLLSITAVLIMFEVAPVWQQKSPAYVFYPCRCEMGRPGWNLIRPYVGLTTWDVAHSALQITRHWHDVLRMLHTSLDKSSAVRPTEAQSQAYYIAPIGLLYIRISC